MLHQNSKEYLMRKISHYGWTWTQRNENERAGTARFIVNFYTFAVSVALVNFVWKCSVQNIFVLFLYANARRPSADYAPRAGARLLYTAPLNLVYYVRAAGEQPCLSLFTFEYFAPHITFTLLVKSSTGSW